MFGKQCHCYIQGVLNVGFTLKIATAMFAETLKTLQQSTWLIPES
jgi:hypothetical protein